MLLRVLAILALLLSLPGPVRAGDAFDDFASGVRSDKVERRREALERYLTDPDAVPGDRRARVEKMLLRVLERDSEPDLRGLAARCLGHHRSTENDGRILQRLVTEASFKAQRPMLSALAGYDDPGLLALVTKRAFKEPRDDVRALYVELLGSAAGGAGLRSLLQMTQVGLPWPVGIAAAIALSRQRDPRAVERLIDLLWSETPGVKAAAHEGLVRLTGKRDLPAEPAKWVAWWNEAKDGFVFPGAKPARPGEVVTVPSEPASVPTYYDIPVEGRRVVFCLDVSASMWGPKTEAAVAELTRAIQSLPTAYEFGLIFFNEHPMPWREELTPAWPYQKMEAVALFSDMETKKYTNIFDTLERALGFAGLGRWALPGPPGVDDVFLLTDGEPNRGRYRDEKGILAGLAALDPHHRVRIHTISVGPVPKTLMASIARQQGGRHHHVEAPR